MVYVGCIKLIGPYMPAQGSGGGIFSLSGLVSKKIRYCIQ